MMSDTNGKLLSALGHIAQALASHDVKFTLVGGPCRYKAPE